MATANVLYSDRFCELTKGDLKIYTFYFPTFHSRHVELANIKAVYHEPHHFDFATTKAWGMTLTPVWWACDMARTFNSGSNVAIDCGEKTHKGFSVERIDEFIEALKPMLNQGVEIKNKFPWGSEKE